VKSRWRALLTVVAVVGGGALAAFAIALVRRALGRRGPETEPPTPSTRSAAAGVVPAEAARPDRRPSAGDPPAATFDLVIGDGRTQLLPPDLPPEPTVAERLIPHVRDPEEVLAAVVPGEAERRAADPFAGAGGLRLAIVLVVVTVALVLGVLAATGRLGV